MFGKKCELCGGKIVNYICEDCGLDSRKSDEYYRGNESNDELFSRKNYGLNQSDDTLTSHEIEQQKQLQSRAEKKQYAKAKAEKAEQKDKNKKIATVATVLGILMAIVTTGVDLIEQYAYEQSYDFSYEDLPEIELKTGEWTSEISVDSAALLEELESIGALDFSTDPYGSISGLELDYSNAQYVLEETGETFSGWIDPGVYFVGVHMPEGIYDLTASGRGSIEVFDAPNGIVGTWNYDNESSETDREIQLYNGAVVIIEGMGILFESENVDYTTMSFEEIEYAEDVWFNVGRQGALESGLDFEPGIYDLYTLLGEYEVFIDIYPDEPSKIVSYAFSMSSDDSEDTVNNFNNVYLPEGAIIYLTNLEGNDSDIEIMLFQKISSILEMHELHYSDKISIYQ